MILLNVIEIVVHREANMFKKYLIALVVLSFLSSCGNKKDDMFWLLALGGNGNSKSTQTDENVIPVTEDVVEESVEESVEEPMDETVTEEVSSENNEPTETPAIEIVNEDAHRAPDESGDASFKFSTTRNLTVNLAVQDDNGPATNVKVVIVNTDEGDENVVFRALSDESGMVKGQFTIADTVETVTLRITIGEETITETIHVSDLIGISRTVHFQGSVPEVQIADRDSDGIPDEEDAYPDDPEMATIVSTPTIGKAIVAFEDLYPGKGDADFNDYVTSIRYEEDLNGKGEVVRVRAYFQHLARGAGYRHELRLTIPGDVDGDSRVKRYDFDGALEDEVVYNSVKDILLLGSSDTTIQSSNTSSGDAVNISYGKSAEVEIEFLSPVSTSVIGSAPYDLYLDVLSTNKEVHFPGFFQDNDGNDQYLDKDGFPWAIMVPREWNWPLEKMRVDDVGANPGCYPYFDDWYKSSGVDYKDWYLEYDAECVFPYIENTSNLAGFMVVGGNNLRILIITILVSAGGLALVYTLRRFRGSHMS